jgi:hypothetical protein
VEAVGRVLRVYQCFETVGKIKELQYMALKPSRSPDFNLSHSLQELKNGIIIEIVSKVKTGRFAVKRMKDYEMVYFNFCYYS